MADKNLFGLKRFFQTSIIYFIGGVMSKIVSFLLLPLYTSYLSPAQFGQYDLAYTFINLIVPIVFFQIWDGAFRFSFDKDKTNDKYYVISNAFMVFAVGIILYLPAIYLVSDYFKFEYVWAIIIYGITVGLQSLTTFSARIFLDNKLFVLSGMVNAFAAAIINVILILVFHFDILSIYIGAICGGICQILLITFRLGLLKSFSFSDLDKRLCVKMLQFSIPLCFATISYWLLSGFTKLCITNKLGMSANGLYAITAKFSTAILLLVNVFQFSWNELAYIISNDNSRVAKYELSADFFIKSILFGTVVVCVFVKWIFPYFVGPEFAPAYYLVPITIVGVSLNTISDFFGTFFMMEKKTHHILYTTLIAAAVNCLCCSKAIDYYGIEGALYVLSGAFLLLMLIRMYIVSSKFGMKIKFTSLLGLAYLPVIFVCYNVESVVFDSCAILVIMFFYIFSIRNYLQIFFKSKK